MLGPVRDGPSGGPGAAVLGGMVRTLPDRTRKDLVSQLFAARVSAREWVPHVLAQTVALSSRRQALAGALAAGPYQALVYLSAKVAKRLRGVTARR